MGIRFSLLVKKKFLLNIGEYSSIGRTAVCGIVYPCSIQGIHPNKLNNIQFFRQPDVYIL
jgi:hypothetical protein